MHKLSIVILVVTLCLCLFGCAPANQTENIAAITDPPASPAVTQPTEPAVTQYFVPEAEAALLAYYETWFFGDTTKMMASAPQEYWDFLAYNADYSYETLSPYLPVFSQNELQAYEQLCGTDITITLNVTNSFQVSQDFAQSCKDFLEYEYRLDSSKLGDILSLSGELVISGEADQHSLAFQYYVCNYDGLWYPAADYYYDSSQKVINFLTTQLIDSLSFYYDSQSGSQPS